MRSLDTAKPFVLLDDARPGSDAHAHLYREPLDEIVARHPSEIYPALEHMRAESRKGRYLAGYIGYEAGLALEDRLTPLTTRPAKAPLLWFGVFDNVEPLGKGDLEALLGDPEGAWAGTPAPRIRLEDYRAAVAILLDFIAAGDIYQANYTFPTDVAFAGTPPALYARLRNAGGAGWGGVIHDGHNWLLSCSPELFFTLEEGKLTARPMKGTLPASGDPDVLRSDTKQRAENLMIVDLIRNDLSRVATPGSVAVPRLFEIESYPTVHQMTSTVTASLRADCDAIDVVASLFPCGSVTGAPKIRAMELIGLLELEERGPYTGSIGHVDPDGNAAFNVAIRTLMIPERSRSAVMGLGSAIVADSVPDAEWSECLAKGRFVTASATPFDLVETMKFDAEEGLIRLERHLVRLRASAATLGFTCDRHALRNELQAATFRLHRDCRVRMRLSPTGAVAIEVTDMPPTPFIADVMLVRRPVPRDDFRLLHKTSDRSFYDRARNAAGTFEVALVDDDGFLTEGSFTNIFVMRDGKLVTPPLARRLLAGVLREELIEEGKAIEGELCATDLEGEFLIGNALRGLIPARLVAGANEAGL